MIRLGLSDDLNTFFYTGSTGFFLLKNNFKAYCVVPFDAADVPKTGHLYTGNMYKLSPFYDWFFSHCIV